MTPSALPTWARVGIGVARRGGVPGLRLRPRPPCGPRRLDRRPRRRRCSRTGSRRSGRAAVRVGVRGACASREDRICGLAGCARVRMPRQLSKCGVPGPQPPPTAARAPSARGSGRRGRTGSRSASASRTSTPSAASSRAVRSRWATPARRRPRRTSPRRRSRPAASRASAGSRTEATSTWWRAVSGPTSGSSPCSTADGSSGVSSTTSARCRPSPSTAPTSARQLVSASTGSQLGHRVLQGRDSTSRPWPALGPRPHRAVAGDEVDPVAGPRGERGQQQRGVHRRVEPRDVVDPAGRGAPGVEHEHHPTVALGLPGADHHVRLRALARQSMLRTSSPRDVLAQRVELRALPAHPHRSPPVELAQPGQPAGQVLAGVERRQHPHRARRLQRWPAGRRGRAARGCATVTRSVRTVAATGRHAAWS